MLRRGASPTNGAISSYSTLAFETLTGNPNTNQFQKIKRDWAIHTGQDQMEAKVCFHYLEVRDFGRFVTYNSGAQKCSDEATNGICYWFVITVLFV
jgi:hypothetical protein